MKKTVVMWLPVLGLLCSGLTGCGRGASVAEENPQAQRQQVMANIQKAQNDPNLTPQMKASIVERLNRQLKDLDSKPAS
jgi:hypothetical protein